MSERQSPKLVPWNDVTDRKQMERVHNRTKTRTGCTRPQGSRATQCPFRRHCRRLKLPDHQQLVSLRWRCSTRAAEHAEEDHATAEAPHLFWERANVLSCLSTTVQIVVSCSENLKILCDVGVQEIFKKPGRGSIEGANEITILRQSWLWERMKFLFRRRPVPSQALCRGC